MMYTLKRTLRAVTSLILIRILHQVYTAQDPTFVVGLVYSKGDLGRIST